MKIGKPVPVAVSTPAVMVAVMVALVVAVSLVAVVVAGVAVPPPAAHAESLWQKSGGNGLFHDRKGMSVGDLITVLIVERSQASQNAATQTGKQGSLAIGPGAGVLEQYLPLVKAGGSDQMKADGTTSRGGQVTAKVTVVVREILPNGNLVVEGKQLISVNHEKQEITVTGVIRPDDIAPDNTVYSTYLAEANIRYSGDGVIGNKQRPGILQYVLGLIF